MRFLERLEARRGLPIVDAAAADETIARVRTLATAGWRLVELTLRHPNSIGVLAEVVAASPATMMIGAGTVRSPAQLDAALAAGAQFAVSPGCTPRLLAHAASCGVPFVPGVATASEVMLCVEHRFDLLKLFPAATLGLATVDALRGPFPEVRYVATGGINAETADTWLAHPAVAAVAGSWLAPF